MSPRAPTPVSCRTLAILAALALLVPATASPAQQILFRNYGVEDGLCQSQVETLVQDSGGYLWVGTQHGISRFDGQSFVTFGAREGLLESTVRTSCRDRHGQIWFGHPSGGLTRVVGERFDVFPASEKRRGCAVAVILEDRQGRLWIGSEGAGVLVIDPLLEEGTELGEGTSPMTVYSLLETDEGMWIGTSNGLFLARVTNKITGQSPELDLERVAPRHLRGLNITCMLQDQEGRVWLGVAEVGLYVLEPPAEDGGRTIHFVSRRDNLPDSGIEDLLSDPQGNLWVALFDSGVLRLRVEGPEARVVELEIFNRENGLAFDYTTDLFRDREGNLWVGTNGGGLSLHRGRLFVTTRHSLDPHILSVLDIFEDRNQVLWFGTDGGLVRYGTLENGGLGLRVFDKRDGLTSSGAHSIIEVPGGDLFMATLQGELIRWDPELLDFETLQTSEPLKNIISLLPDSTGNLWILTAEGVAVTALTAIAHREPDARLPIAFSPLDLDREEAWIRGGALDSAGTLWLVTTEGLCRFEPDPWNERKRIKLTIPRRPPDGAGFDSIAIDDRDTIWLATVDGQLFRSDGASATQVDASRPDEDLSRDSIYLLVCRDRDVFIGTNNGLYKYRSDTGGLKHYGLRDGFLGVETNGNAVGYDHEGGIWFGTVRGAVRYDSSFESVNALPPQLHLTGVSVHLKPVEIVSSATFRYDQNHITFEFVGVSLKNADKVLYECRLLGADREPVVTTNRRFITYSNLPPGEYTFQVRARNEDDVWTPEPLQYSFSIHAPFWMMWWFEPLSILLVMGIVAGGYGLRARTMARLNIVLEETVHERTEELTLRNLDVEKANRALEGALRAATQASEAKAIFLANMSHEIRTPLNGVIGMTDLLLDTELGEEQTEYAHTVRDSGRALLAIINDVLDFSKIEAGKLEIDMVEFDLSQQLVTILRILSRPAHKKELELWCEVSPDVPGRVIGDALRTSQVLTNLLGNAVKFTESGCVTLNIDLMETSPDRLRLRFRVTDTGIGIPEAKLSEIFAAFSQADSSTTRRFGGTGLGLAISSRLVELMGGCLTVESQPHQGTTFEFSLPLRHAEGAVPPRPHDIAGKRVLVAVESALARSILERTLVAWEARVVVTDPTSDAWQGPAPPGAGEDQVDVVIVDGGQMGNHPSPALERIRQDDCFSRSATIHLTRRDRWQGGVSGESARVETLLPRPFTPADLVSALEYSLRSVQAGKIVTRKVLTATRPTGPTLSILLVEDNPVNQRVASGLLTRQGHRVSIAGNGREALEILEAGGCFDLVFMDVQMPEMDGLEATRAIREGEREGGPHLPIVAMTAHAVKGDREKCISAGMDDYLTKPIDMREVRRVLAVYCPSEGEEGAQGPHQAGPGALA